jgi:hypothetical protein
MSYAVITIFSLFVVFILFCSGKLKQVTLAQLLGGSANCFGVFLITILLGYGLIAVPRNVWQNRCLAMKIRFYYFKLSQVENDIFDQTFDLEEKTKLALCLQKKNSTPILSQTLSSLPPGILSCSTSSLDSSLESELLS